MQWWWHTLKKRAPPLPFIRPILYAILNIDESFLFSIQLKNVQKNFKSRIVYAFKLDSFLLNQQQCPCPPSSPSALFEYHRWSCAVCATKTNAKQRCQNRSSISFILCYTKKEKKLWTQSVCLHFYIIIVFFVRVCVAWAGGWMGGYGKKTNYYVSFAF